LDAAKEKLKEIEKENTSKVIKKINGVDLNFTFKEVWELYKEKHLRKQEYSTYIRRIQDVGFYTEILDVKMIDFNAKLISDHIALRKKLILSNPNTRKYNFDNDIKNLSALFNWYREVYDDQFINPILKRHKTEGFLRKVPKKKKKLKAHELLAFFEALEKDSLFWRDFAEIQFFFSSRVQEIAGLLRSSVDFIDEVVEIENVMIWGQDKKMLYLKDSPKNGEDRIVTFNNKIREILNRRVLDNPLQPWKVCPQSGKVLELVFHINGKPLSYRQIQYHYNKALKRVGLSGKYSSTHIMRHSMANIVRERLDLDSAQAVGGWKTRDLVENVYTDMPTHKADEARKNVEDFLYESSEEEPDPTGPNTPSQVKGMKLRLVN
tara:strand:- start:136 stop:1269 length:1134 start_codon:yes stop_codon:yes gene_type:complete